jgi:hypothetical protein
MKFYSIKALTLSAAFLGLCSAYPAFADDGSIPVDLPWVNEQVDTVCPMGTIPKICANAVVDCREAAVSSIYAVFQLEYCSWVQGFDFSCYSTQIKNVFY